MGLWNLNDLWRLPKLWKLSDLAMLMLASVFAFNMLIILLLLCRRRIERRMGMHQLDRLLKGVLLYSLFILPVFTGLNLFSQTYKDVWIPKGDDVFGYGMEIGNQSISTRTGYGNHWVFLLVFIVWLFGVVCLGLRNILRNCLFLKRLERFGDYLPDTELEGFMAELQQELGIKRHIVLVVNPIVSEPFVTGFLRPRLFFPEGEMEKSTRKMMLKHELVHCGKRDYFYRRLMFFICTLYWFNPVMYYFADYFIEVNEMACDEKALEGMSKQERYEYAVLLAGMEENGLPLPNAASLAGHTGNGLVRRIENMSRKKGKVNRLVFSSLVAAVFVCCPLTTFAASLGVSKAQAVVLDMVTEEHEEKMQEMIMTEYTDLDPQVPLAKAAAQIGARGTNSIDVTINGKAAQGVGTYTLSKGDKVDFALMGDKSTDKFRAGLENSTGGRTYVISSKGIVSHTFTIPADGTYTFFIEGTTTSTIHVTGRITL